MAPAAAPIIRNLDSTADDTANNQYKRFIAGMKAKDNAEERNREKQLLQGHRHDGRRDQWSS